VELPDASTYCELAVGRGAARAVVVDPHSVVTATWVRMKCQYGCGGYGSNLCCPPHTPTPDQTRAMLDEYSTGVLVSSAGQVDVKGLVVDLEREAFLAGYYRAFAYGAGPCGLCEPCPLGRCVHAERARPAMEACGIDVFATARAHGFEISVVRDSGDPQTYFGLLLLD